MSTDFALCPRCGEPYNGSEGTIVLDAEVCPACIENGARRDEGRYGWWIIRRPDIGTAAVPKWDAATAAKAARSGTAVKELTGEDRAAALNEIRDRLLAKVKEERLPILKMDRCGITAQDLREKRYGAHSPTEGWKIWMYQTGLGNPGRACIRHADHSDEAYNRSYNRAWHAGRNGAMCEAICEKHGAPCARLFGHKGDHT